MSDFPYSGAVTDNRYRLDSVLANSGFGSVWKATDLATNASVAIKLTYLSKGIVGNEYARHLQSLAKSASNNALTGSILPVAFGTFEDHFYEVLPYIEDLITLERLVEPEELIHPFVALKYIASIATAVAELHSRSIVHCDLKPSNVVIVDPLNYDTRLIDFGMVRIEGSTAEIFGTFNFLHPLLTGRLTSGPAAISMARRAIVTASAGPYIDIYSVGVIGYLRGLYKMNAGSSFMGQRGSIAFEMKKDLGGY